MAQVQIALVTGGAGFIGSHLSEALLNQGYRVLCVDNLSTGNEENIRHLKNNPLFEFIRFDVTSVLSGIFHVDYVFHLASPASVPDYQRLPEETALVNSVGTRLLLKLAKAAGAKFLFASTSEVYGDPLEHPQKETYWGNVNPHGVRACYDESKRYGEMLTMLYCRNYGLDGRIVRIFNTYGPKMRSDDGRVISNFINQALAGGPLTVYGDGKQTRSFCYISDLVAGLLKAMFTPQTKGEVINLGNPEESMVLNLAQKIRDLIYPQAKIVFQDLPPDDPVRRQPDITKAKKLLGWDPVIQLEEGLSETVGYYRNLRSRK
jgi:nucleoside-diphosphate-sugar epimerase